MVSGISSYDTTMVQRLQALLSNTSTNTANQTTRQGKFIDKLIAQMNTNFSQIDTDSNGAVSKDELTAYLAQKFQEFSQKTGKTTDQTTQSQAITNLVDKIFTQLDPSNTGSITKDQLAQALQDIVSQLATESTHKHHHHRHMASQTQGVDQLITQIFSAMDTNKDGTVDASELAAATSSTSGQNTSTTSDSTLSFLQSLVGQNGVNGLSSINSFPTLTGATQTSNDLGSILALLEKAL